MTYCCGILVRDGLVMIADTRTNAGLDNISTYRKLSLVEVPGERVLVLASDGVDRVLEWVRETDRSNLIRAIEQLRARQE